MSLKLRVYGILEPGDDDSKYFDPFIIAAMWYTVVTLSTVGYGDLYPTTDIGRVIGSLTVCFGVVLVAILTGIVASGFSEELKKHNGEK